MTRKIFQASPAPRVAKSLAGTKPQTQTQKTHLRRVQVGLSVWMLRLSPAVVLVVLDFILNLLACAVVVWATPAFVVCVFHSVIPVIRGIIVPSWAHNLSPPRCSLLNPV